jgi:hypothetical protein
MSAGLKSMAHGRRTHGWRPSATRPRKRTSSRSRFSISTACCATHERVAIQRSRKTVDKDYSIFSMNIRPSISEARLLLFDVTRSVPGAATPGATRGKTSEQRAELSVLAKHAEDPIAAAQKEAHDKAMGHRNKARCPRAMPR